MKNDVKITDGIRKTIAHAFLMSYIMNMKMIYFGNR